VSAAGLAGRAPATRLLGAVVAAALLAATPALGAAAARRVVGNCDRSQVRPATIWISCNDPSFAFTRLRWSSFGGPAAHAAGLMRLESCPSACNAGSVRRYPVGLVFSSAARCPDGHDDYRTVAVSFSTSARPPGSPAKPTPLALFCPLTD